MNREKMVLLTICVGLFLAVACQSSSLNPNTITESSTEFSTALGINPVLESSMANDNDKADKDKEADEEKLDEEKLDNENKPDTKFTLVISGDVLSHNSNWQAADLGDGRFDYMPQLGDLEGLLSNGDYTLVNLETPISGEKYGYRGFPKFNAPVNLGQTLKKIGVDLVVTGNNHALDNGLEGLHSNLDNLDRIGLDYVGTYRSKEEAEEAKVVDINGIKVGFAASTIRLKMEVPDDYSLNLNRESVIRREIAKVREAGAEIVVFHIHWGKEYEEKPSEMQKTLYKILADEGVDIVIGSHPHRLQPIEMKEINYQGKAKNQAVIWSTADLLWGEPISKKYVKTGAVFQVEVSRQNGQIQVQDMDYDLIYNLTWFDKDGKKQIRVIPESEMENFRKTHPKEVQQMEKEMAWAHGVLARSVNLD